MIKTFLITGGAGFIGSSLADSLLEKGQRVVVVDNFDDYYDPKIKRQNVVSHLGKSNYKLYEADITNLDAMENVFKENKIDRIVHLAARAGVRPSLENPIGYAVTNVVGTNVILELARKYGIKKLVLASSSSVYGNNKKVPFSEEDNVDKAISPYAASKKENEVLAHVYHAIYNLDIILLRFFTVYGPRQRPDLAINKFVSSIEKDLPIELYGDGHTYRDYTFIDDIVNGIELSLDYLNKHHGVYEIINLGSNNPIKLIQMIETIERALGKKAKINHLPMQLGDVDRTYADITKANKLLGYKPSISFEEGVKAFVRWKKEI